MFDYKNKAIVLGISGNGLGIARSLGRRGVEVVVVTDTDRSANLFSRFISEKWFFCGSESALVEELVNRGGSFTDKPVLFPVRDATVLALADRLEEVKKYYHLAMPAADTVKKALCKTTFFQMAEEFGLAVPKSFSIRNFDEITQLPDNVKYPVIVKPEYRNDSYIANVSGKAFVAKDSDEMLESYGKFSEYQPQAIIQEYIPGSDSDLYFCFQYYKKNTKLAASLCGRKIRQYPPLCGSTSSCEVVSSPEVEEITTRFFKRINFVGPCSMEMKRDPRDGKFYLIEPTVGRLDWNNGFAEGNGLPIPFMNYLDALGLPFSEFIPKKISRRWIRWSSDFESAKIDRNNGNLSLWAWLWSIRPPVTSAIFAVDDPLPFMIQLFRRIKRKYTNVVDRIIKISKKKSRKLYFSEKYIIFKKNIDKDNLPSVVDKLSFKEANPEDIHEFIRRFKPHYNENDYGSLLSRINSGDFLILGYVKDTPNTPCSFFWLTEKDKFFLEKQKAAYQSDEICSCRAYVLEQFRNIGFSSNYRKFVESFVLEKGYKSIISFVRKNNFYQIKALKSTGCSEIGYLWRRVIFGKEFIKLELL
ncbi:hypothetical protein JWG42_12640 [Desulfoprunum benzoelyticum]|uniref:Putative ATP-grasp superfamily ATP-dependent carboligase n=1 Tax=Desulfoprunum benzoelyticum TaxID=1506996 RepID=A0A840UQS1_9BACT|nr:hypothetical protein [Desulfoprunum benzoelyticum]MBB5346983.1 putative ATP-grasp superfamily ATP-dependent carboligase [Desulfoprunum benzoelyticum]MBM9530999.1 hypothetical protein [Desulfoprunum benzoelyticum]